jgi:hypothetical protein
MGDNLLGLHVERASAGDGFVWVIAELRAYEDSIEVAASLQTFNKASDAMVAGEKVLRGLGLQPALPSGGVPAPRWRWAT